MDAAKSLGFLSGLSLLFLVLGSLWAHAAPITLPFIAGLFLSNLLLGVLLPKVFPKNPFFSGFHNGIQEFGKKANFAVVSAALVAVYLLGVGVTWGFSKITGKNFLRMKATGKSSWVDVSQKKRNFEEMF
ncbi:MAG: hypothetical protein Q7K34_02865 [archaeon]|nr:hypothetical protein [archaeon]